MINIAYFNRYIVDRREILILLLILLTAFAIRFYTAINIGEMWDEIAVAGYGKVYVGAIKNLDFSPKVWEINYEHPPMAKYIFGISAAIEERLPIIQNTFDYMYHPDKRYFLAKMASVIMGLICIYMVYRIGKEWFNAKVGLFAASFLALMPHFIAHNVIAGIETPQGLFSIFYVYFYIKALSTYSNKFFLLSFFFWALFFLTKFSAIFFLPLNLVLLAINYKHYINKKSLILIHLLGGIVVVITIYLLWPWLWINPMNIIKSFGFFKNSYAGEYILGRIQSPPFYYYFLYLLATTPPILLLLGFLSIKNKNVNKKYYLYTIIWLLTPFLMSFLNLKKDGIRYVITCMPPLAIIAGIGLDYLITISHKAMNFSLWLYRICGIGRQPRTSLRGDITKIKSINYKRLLLFSTYFLLFIPIYAFYPHYLDYYNLTVGGVQTVYKYKLLDYDWWGEGIKQAIMFTNKNYNDKTIYLMLKPLHVSPTINKSLKVLSDDEVLNQKIMPDIIVISENYFYYNRTIPPLKDYKKEYVVNVQNAPLVTVYKKIEL